MKGLPIVITHFLWYNFPANGGVFMPGFIPEKFFLLQLGTRIRYKGENDVEGAIIKYSTVEGERKGYWVKPDDASIGNLLVALDDDFEVLKQ
jgi:hypothetical protein